MSLGLVRSELGEDDRWCANMHVGQWKIVAGNKACTICRVHVQS